LLSDEYEERLRKFRTLYGDKTKNEPVFLTREGQPYTKNAFYEPWYKFKNKIRKLMGEAPFNHKPHDLRATFGTNWLEAALNAGYAASEALASLKLVMGHENETTTMKYIDFHNKNDMSDEVASFMDTYADEARNEFEKAKI
jgi:integrase